MGHPVRISGKRVSAALKAGSREPFMDLVEMILRSQPSGDDWRKMAGQNPKQFAEALRIISQLAGFSDKLEVQGSFAMGVARMGDAELRLAYEDHRRHFESQAEEANQIELEAMPEGENLGKVG